MATGLAIIRDGRDYLGTPDNVSIDRTTNTRGSLLPPSFIVRKQPKTVLCCVSIAVTTCLELLDYRFNNRPYQPLSVLFNYWQVRNLKNMNVNDPQIELGFQDCFEAARLRGACPRDMHPQRITRSNAAIRPSVSALEAAKAFRERQEQGRRVST